VTHKANSLLSPPNPRLTPTLKGTLYNLWKKLIPQKLEGWCYWKVKIT